MNLPWPGLHPSCSSSSALVQVTCVSLNPAVSVSVFDASCLLHRLLPWGSRTPLLWPPIPSQPQSHQQLLLLYFQELASQESTVLCPLLKSPLKYVFCSFSAHSLSHSFKNIYRRKICIFISPSWTCLLNSTLTYLTSPLQFYKLLKFDMFKAKLFLSRNIPPIVLSHHSKWQIHSSCFSGKKFLNLHLPYSTSQLSASPVHSASKYTQHLISPITSVLICCGLLQ